MIMRNVPGLLPSIVVVAVLVGYAAAAAEPGGLLRVTVDPSEIRISDRSRLVLAYVIEPRPVPPGVDEACRRSGMLHPVCSPRGTVVTAEHPRDHPHQSGIFTAWTNTRVDGHRVDFWNLHHGQGRVLHASVRRTFEARDGAGFEVDLLHRAELPIAVDVVRETWTVTGRPTDGSHHCFDLDTVQRAIPPATLTVVKHHYGGLGIRGPEAWLQPTDADVRARPPPDAPPTGAVIINSLGQDRLAGNLSRIRWVAMASRPPAAAACIVALVHPSSFRSPQAARLHPTKPYFCFAPCADGDFTIDAAAEWKARYRFLVTDEPADPHWIEDRWRDWIAGSDP